MRDRGELIALLKALDLEFARLGISVDDDPYNGIMAGLAHEEGDREEGEEIPPIVNLAALSALVTLFDDRASGDYYGMPLLNFLKTLQPEEITLERDSETIVKNNFWQLISQFEAR
jgi:hypothetical protein